MTASLVIALLFSLGFGVELLRWKPKNDGTQVSREALQLFWAISVAAFIALGAAYVVQRHAAEQQSMMEQRIDDLENQVNNLEGQMADMENNKVSRR